MPIYSANITYRGGFYNNKQTNGVNDRVYTAEDVRKPYDTVFTDGIMPAADGTAEVFAAADDQASTNHYPGGRNVQRL